MFAAQEKTGTSTGAASSTMLCEAAPSGKPPVLKPRADRTTGYQPLDVYPSAYQRTRQEDGEEVGPEEDQFTGLKNDDLIESCDRRTYTCGKPSHRMYEEVNFRMETECDGCGFQVPTNTLFMHCFQCNFVLCDSCHPMLYGPEESVYRVDLRPTIFSSHNITEYKGEKFVWDEYQGGFQMIKGHFQWKDEGACKWSDIFEELDAEGQVRKERVQEYEARNRRRNPQLDEVGFNQEVVMERYIKEHMVRRRKHSGETVGERRRRRASMGKSEDKAPTEDALSEGEWSEDSWGENPNPNIFNTSYQDKTG